jgi:apolipoprotein N-acyltransferase
MRVVTMPAIRPLHVRGWIYILPFLLATGAIAALTLAGSGLVGFGCFVAVLAFVVRQTDQRQARRMMFVYMLTQVLVVIGSSLFLYNSLSTELALICLTVVGSAFAYAFSAFRCTPTLTNSRLALVFPVVLALQDLLIRLCVGTFDLAYPYFSDLTLFAPIFSPLYAAYGEFGGAVFVFALAVFLVFAGYQRWAEAAQTGGLVAALLLGLPFFGNEEPNRQDLNVNLIQPGIASEAHFAQDMTEFLRSSGDLVSQRSMNVLPEGTLTRYQPIDGLPAELAKTPLAIIGGLYSPPGGLRYNSALLFEQGKLQARYDKQMLVPVEETSFIFSGSKVQSNILLVHKRPVGVLICFEAGSTAFAEQAVRRGALALIVLSDTQGWLATLLYRQNLRRLAAMFNHEIAYSSMAGFSARIDQRGNVVQQIGWAIPGHVEIQLRTAASLPNGVKHKTAVVVGILLLSYLLCIVPSLRRPRRESAGP